MSCTVLPISLAVAVQENDTRLESGIRLNPAADRDETHTLTYHFQPWFVRRVF
jgi:hypothetical protein